MNRVNEICRGKRSVTPTTAVLLAALTGTGCQFWLYLQYDYDLWYAMQETDTSKVRPLQPLEATR